MEQRKDIGAFFKKKLEGATKTPSDQLWDRIETSLDKNDKNRKGVFIIWFTAASVAVLFTSLWVITTSPNPQPTQPLPKRDKLTQTKEISLPTKSSNNDSLETDTKELLSQEPNIHNIQFSNNENTNTENELEESKVYAEVEQNIKTTYHYYNSETEENVETSNLKVIDSLVNRHNMLEDTLIIDGKKIILKRDSL